MLALLSLAHPRPGAAQGKPLHVDRFTVDDGLAQNTVNSVAQDRSGYIWVGTTRGLQRFDGYSFVPYASLDPRAPPELAGNIYAIHVDPIGNVWVGTQHALFRIASGRGSVTRVPFAGFWYRFASDSAGRLWFVDGETLKWIDTKRDDATAVTVLRDSTFASCGVSATTQRGALWLACIRDVHTDAVLLDPSTGQSRLRVPAAVARLEGPDQRVWFTRNDGLALLDRTSDRPRMIDAFAGLSVATLSLDRDSTVLVPTDHWLARLDRTGKVMERWDPPEAFADAPLPRSLLIDREGAFWLGTTTSGLLRLDPTRPAFEHLSRKSNPPLPLASDFVMALFEARDGSLWVGTLRGGALRAIRHGSRIDTFRHDARIPTSLPSEEVWDFEEDKNGNLWVATQRGICKAAGSAFHCLRASKVEEAAADLTRDAEGFFWVARGTGGVTSFDPATRQVGPAVRPPRFAISVFADRDSGYLWIGAERLFRDALAIYDRSLEPDDPYRIAPLLGVGNALIRQGQVASCEPPMRQALRIARASLRPEHWLTGNVESNLGGCLMAQRRYREAEPFVVAGHERLKAALSAGDPRIRSAEERVAALRAAQQHP